MKKYNTTTKELFRFINFENSNLFNSLKKDTKIKRVKYCYVLPQRVHSWSGNHKTQTMYYFLFWRIIVSHLYSK